MRTLRLEPPRSGEWEEPPHTEPVGNQLLVAVVALLLGIALVGALTSRSDPGGTLAVGPSPSPVAQPGDRSAAAFRFIDLEPLETIDDQPGDGLVLRDTTARSILATTAAGLLHVIDIASGDRRTLRLPDALAHEQLTTMFAVGDEIIIGTYGQVVALSGDDLRPVQVATNHVALRTHAESSLWMLSLGQQGPTRNAVRIGLDGAVERAVALPAIIDPAAGTSDVLVVSAPGGVDVISGDGGNVAHRLSGDVAAVGDDRLARIACMTDLRCQVIIGSFDDPDQTRAPLAASDVPGSYYGSASGRFSPDGRWLALPLLRIGPIGLEQTAVAMIDTTIGAEVGRVRATRMQPFFADQIVWTPDSRWLVLVSSTGLQAWDVRERRTVGLAVDALGANAIAVR